MYANRLLLTCLLARNTASLEGKALYETEQVSMSFFAILSSNAIHLSLSSLNICYFSTEVCNDVQIGNDESSIVPSNIQALILLYMYQHGAHMNKKYGACILTMVYFSLF